MCSTNLLNNLKNSEFKFLMLDQKPPYCPGQYGIFVKFTSFVNLLKLPSLLEVNWFSYLMLKAGNSYGVCLCQFHYTNGYGLPVMCIQ